MLKITKLSHKPAFNKNNSNKSAYEKDNSNNEVNRFDISDNNVEYIKKLKKSKG